MTAPQALGDGALADDAASEVAAAAAFFGAVDAGQATAVPMPMAVPGPASEAVASTRAQAAPQAPMVQPALAAAEAEAEAEPAFELPVDSLAAMAQSAGLQWVNSDAEKIRAVQAALDSEAAPARVPRERKPVAPVDDGPLVLVETRKDLSQYKLPFEKAGQGSVARE